MDKVPVVPDLAALVKDSKKLNLLEDRLLGRSPPQKPHMAFLNQQQSSPGKPSSDDKMPREASVSTVIDEIPSSISMNMHNENFQNSQLENRPRPPATEIIVIESNSPLHSENNSMLSANYDLQNNAEKPRPRIGEKRGRVEDVAGGLEMDTRSQLTNESMNHSQDRAPRQKLGHDDDNQSPNQGADNGSRGHAPAKRTIVSYFVPPAEPAATAIFPSSKKTEKEKAGAENGKSAAHSSSSSAAGEAPESTSSEAKPKSSKSVAAASAAATAGVLELKKQLDQARILKEQAEQKCQRLEFEMKAAQDKTKAVEEQSSKITRALEEVYRKMAQQEMRRKKDRLALDCVRLGKIVQTRTSATQIGEVWEEGYAWKDLSRRQAELLERKEELESRKKKLATLKRAAKKTSAEGLDSVAEAEGLSNGSTGASAGAAVGDIDLELVAEGEAIRYHLEQLKRDEVALAEERRLLESEKALHIKELRRTQCEERSLFYRSLPLLHERYLLQCMLGRGGFSEVWKAFDLLDLREVAVKIHQLNPTWTESHKTSYIKHVTREYTIHKSMKHPRVVQLFDVFEIDVNSFATVLEYCRGIDLDEKLKRHKTIPEKDARMILMQIMSGLRYLNRGGDVEGGSTASKKTIIHFDLKPENILFDEHDDVKITDFGLSKVIDESTQGTSMELTSQGAGTYWYLPPECFARGPEPPRISSKVDVWSAGIIFYQMLYGFRPYGEGKTQGDVWGENIILNAHQVEFPSDAKAPKVSEEAKDLIRACLTRDQRLRPDVLTVCQHSYLRMK